MVHCALLVRFEAKPGKEAEALFAESPDLFAREPLVEEIDIIADKLPGSGSKSRELPPEAYAP